MKLPKLIVAVLMSAAAMHTANVASETSVVLDPSQICIYEDRMYSVGSVVTFMISLEGYLAECAKAKPNSYQLDGKYSARWIPAEAAKRQQGHSRD